VTTADLTGATASATSAPGGRTRRATLREQWAWTGLLPFFAFLFLFLLLPTYGVINGAFHDVKGHLTWKALSDAVSQEKKSFYLSLKLSFLTAFLGAIIGTVLAYAAVTAKRPKWLRNLVTAFSGVAANMGGVVLAFLFISLLGAQGLGTKVLKAAGWDLYSGKFNLNGFAGWATVYMYFQIPLMILVTLPAVDGLKDSWREASSNLGGTTFTYWRRVGLPVLMPSMLGGFMLLFANSFSAFATAAVLNAGANLVPVRISFYLQGDISGKSPMPFALATWMILFMAVSMGGYLLLRRRAERWRS
jgi:putative spermidine/putrescine transport system permease protein